MKFIDLFAGLGGFHKALHELGHECVFASEIDPRLQETYNKNWKILPKGDIRKIVKEDIESIPKHDVLCAGFPCQPFSKAGKQMGTEDFERGTLFNEIIAILKYRKPKYFILENVAFIKMHSDGDTWKDMRRKLVALGYDVDDACYSPLEFGIPQHRKRVFIVGCKGTLGSFNFARVNSHMVSKVDINQFIDSAPSSFKALPIIYQECLKIWQEFIDSIPKTVDMPGFPIWSMEFGATYPYEKKIPHRMTSEELGKYRGNFGISLKGLTKQQQLELLPSYARVKKSFPDWKRRWISANRKFYQENKNQLEGIVSKISQFEFQSWQKLEWNVGDSERIIKNYILQFRASGVRVKKVDFFPSLVCPSSQVPIIAWQNRYITRSEGLKLQSLDGIMLPEFDNAAFKALGNAVNSKIVKLIARELVGEVSREEDSNLKVVGRTTSGTSYPIVSLNEAY